jgi:enterochelin esterase-like enzyme
VATALFFTHPPKGIDMKIVNACALLSFLIMAAVSAPTLAQSRLEMRDIQSAQFSGNRIGILPQRKVTVYLPPHYSDRLRRFPVVYFLNTYGEDHTAPFANHDAKALLDDAIAKGQVADVIVVTADFLTPLGTTWYVNSSVTGNWQDFMIKELVPYIDANYRTMPTAASRAVVGDRMGGHGAIRFGMQYPDVFGVVYAMHPVGTGNGVQPGYTRGNWQTIYAAKTLEDLKTDIYSPIFLSIYQAFLPNPNKPPLYADLPVTLIEGKPALDPAITARLQNSFSLDHLIPIYAANMKRLRALKIDWGRNDTLYDHIYSNQAFVHKLDEYDIPYEAEEYHGGWGDKTWGPDGRFATDLVPFLNKNLLFP